MFGLIIIYQGVRVILGDPGEIRSRSLVSFLRWSRGVELQRSLMLESYSGMVDV